MQPLSVRMLGLSIWCLFAVSCAATPTLAITESAAGAPVQQPADAAGPAQVVADLTRDDAITQLSAQAFLALGDATCVIDALFGETGVYDFNSAVALEQSNQPELIETCTSGTSSGSETEAADTGGTGLIVREVQVLPTPTPVAPAFVLDELSQPAFAPGNIAAPLGEGSVTTGSLTLQGKTFEYSTITPQGFQIGSSAPVFLAFPPGGQDIGIAANVAQFVYAYEAVQRGWVVIAPAAPGGLWWDAENRALIPDLVRWIDAWVDIEGKPHIGGMSNGGSSAFSIAIEHPTLFQSLMAYPGTPTSPAEYSRLDQIRHMPVRMWVGAEDPTWVEAMENATNELRAEGGNVALSIIPGEPHVIGSIQDGKAIFTELDAAR